MTGARLAAFAALLAALATASDASAHERSASYAVWDLDDRGGAVSLKLRARDRDVLRAAANTPSIASRLPTWIALRADGAPCAVAEQVRELSAAAGWARYEWRVACDEPSAIDARGLLRRIPGHLHVVRARRNVRNGSESRERNAEIQATVDVAPDVTTDAALTGTNPMVTIDRPGEAPAGFWRYAALGIDHIAGGADHLLFVFALLVGLGRARDAAFAVTGFTLGHSVTLALVALDVAAARSAPVEALVALSIALVAIDNLWLASGRRDRALAIAGPTLCLAPVAFGVAVPLIALAGLALFCGCQLALLARSNRPERIRINVAALFGLIHGLAFAGALRELTGSVGVGELLGFNIGVELGQLCAVALIWPALAAARRWLGFRTVSGLGSAVAIAAGVAWFVARSAG